MKFKNRLNIWIVDIFTAITIAYTLFYKLNRITYNQIVYLLLNSCKEFISVPLTYQNLLISTIIIVQIYFTIQIKMN